MKYALAETVSNRI